MTAFSDWWFKFWDPDGVPYFYSFLTDDVAFQRPPPPQVRAALAIQVHPPPSPPPLARALPHCISRPHPALLKLHLYCTSH